MSDKRETNLQEKIISEWKMFSNTDAYKDWVKSMDEYMQMIQDNVDNMVEPRPAGGGRTEMQPIDSEKANMLNQRKVGVRYALEYPKLRVEA